MRALLHLHKDSSCSENTGCELTKLRRKGTVGSQFGRVHSLDLPWLLHAATQAINLGIVSSELLENHPLDGKETA